MQERLFRVILLFTCSLYLFKVIWKGKNVLNSMVFVFYLITFKMRNYQGQRWNKHFPQWWCGQSSLFSIFLLGLWWLLLRRSQPWHSKFMTVRTTALLLGLRVSLTFRVLLFHCIHSLKFRQGLADLVICCKKKIFFWQLRLIIAFYFPSRDLPLHCWICSLCWNIWVENSGFSV